MEKILENYSDVGTCGTVLYGDGGMTLYYDANKRDVVYSEDIEELFLKGMFIRMTNGDGEPVIAKPVSLTMPTVHGAMYSVLCQILPDVYITYRTSSKN